jgi:hypothetical protein
MRTNSAGKHVNYLEIYEPDVLADDMQPVLRYGASLFAPMRARMKDLPARLPHTSQASPKGCKGLLERPRTLAVGSLLLRRHWQSEGCGKEGEPGRPRRIAEPTPEESVVSNRVEDGHGCHVAFAAR